VKDNMKKRERKSAAWYRIDETSFKRTWKSRRRRDRAKQRAALFKL